MGEGKGFFESRDDISSTGLARKNSLWKKIQRVPLLLEEIDKPVIAQMHGFALGAGLNMALMCDIRIAAASPKMAESYINVGIVPGDGGINKARSIFEANLDNFKHLGFNVITVCQHGNPTSDFDNRDFFKDESVQMLYPELADIMVDFMDKIHHEYVYISDVGMNFKIVKDPINRMRGNLDKYIELGDGAKKIIRGDARLLCGQLMEQMEKEAAALHFEKAQELKEKLELIEKFCSKTVISNTHIGQMDVFGYDEQDQNVYIAMLHIQNGSIVQGQTIEYKKQLDEPNSRE